jgi:apolipoprotein N-acyltransferase
MNQLARMGLAALAGGAAVFGMAPFNAWPVLLATLAVLAWLIEGAIASPRPVRRAAWTGWAFGLTYFGGGLYWVGEAFYVDPATVWMMPFAVTLLPAGMALFYAAAGALAGAFRRTGAAGALILTAGFAALEFVRGFLFTGFPWNLFGSTLIDTPMAAGAALAGVYGLTFAVLLAGFSLPVLVLGRGALRLIPGVAALALLGGALAFGLLRAAPPAPAQATQVRIVQPDNPQTDKGQRDYLRRLWQRLMALTMGAGADRIDVFIWPEGVINFLDESPEALGAIGDALAPGQLLIAGSARRALTDDGGTRYFNALLAIDGGGQVVAVYDKAHLVPFGEYLPFPEAFRALDIASLTARIGGAFTAGPGPQTLALAGLPPFGAMICYEALFPAAIVAPGERPRWLVNITDDSWFGTQTGPYQHLVAARFRAIEEGLPLVRAATTGVSAVIDADGHAVVQTDLQAAVAIDATLPGAYVTTVFAAWGHGPFLALVLAAFAGGLAWPRRRPVSGGKS